MEGCALEASLHAVGWEDRGSVHSFRLKFRFRLDIRKNPPVQVIDEKLMFKVIKCAFMQKRKTLLNSLTNSKIFENKQVGKEILEILALDENIRAEELSIENFAELTNLLVEKNIAKE